MIRKFRKSDVGALRQIYDKAGYGFAFPAISNLEISFVREEDGRVVQWVGAQMEAQIFMLMDPEWGSPHQRIRAIADFHAPITKQLDLRGVKTANVALDPKFPKFGRRLSKLGWSEALWRCYFMDVKQAVKALLGK